LLATACGTGTGVVVIVRMRVPRMQSVNPSGASDDLAAEAAGHTVTATVDRVAGMAATSTASADQLLSLLDAFLAELPHDLLS
jgi:hypothetical protein